MHFGPTEQERATAAAGSGAWWAGSGGAWGRTGAGGGAGVGGAQRPQAFATAGLSETQHYRVFAAAYREARRAQDRGLPRTAAALAALMAGVYLVVTQIQDRGRGGERI